MQRENLIKSSHHYFLPQNSWWCWRRYCVPPFILFFKNVSPELDLILTVFILFDKIFIFFTHLRICGDKSAFFLIKNLSCSLFSKEDVTTEFFFINRNQTYKLFSVKKLYLCFSLNNSIVDLMFFWLARWVNDITVSVDV